MQNSARILKSALSGKYNAGFSECAFFGKDGTITTMDMVEGCRVETDEKFDAAVSLEQLSLYLDTFPEYDPLPVAELGDKAVTLRAGKSHVDLDLVNIEVPTWPIQGDTPQKVLEDNRWLPVAIEFANLFGTETPSIFNKGWTMINSSLGHAISLHKSKCEGEFIVNPNWAKTLSRYMGHSAVDKIYITDRLLIAIYKDESVFYTSRMIPPGHSLPQGKENEFEQTQVLPVHLQAFSRAALHSTIDISGNGKKILLSSPNGKYEEEVDLPLNIEGRFSTDFIGKLLRISKWVATKRNNLHFGSDVAVYCCNSLQKTK